MAVISKPVAKFEDWYDRYDIDQRDDTVANFLVNPTGAAMWKAYDQYKREMDTRVANFESLIKQADAQVVSEKPDLPNVSSGEVAGMVRRMARNLVQHTPNVEVISVHDDDSISGVFVTQILKSKIIGDDLYSNDMQQNLFASTKTALTIGFDCVVPVLLQDAAGGWFIKYDNIYYRDVFPEPGAKDVRSATDAFVRRYLTKGEVAALVRNQTPGWDINALKTLLKTNPPVRDLNSVDHQSKKSHSVPEGYEIITYYSNTGEPFLTFSENTKLLLRIEKNKDPLKRHPVHFLVLEKDLNQPLGKSQVELVFGRQEFQDLMLNGAMKLWYRNINPAIIGYGTVNAIPNLSPGKYTNIANPNAKVEPFEVNTQSLMQFNAISQANAGSMIQMVGAADQQMASQNSGGTGMSQTPQGVEAQQQMVDITTNNYQKAIEAFFSRYCSYALTVYFAELKGSVSKITPTADTRKALLNAGLDAEKNFEDDGSLKDVEWDKLVTEYWVRTIPGSLVEMEDEKQLRILNQLFVPLSQAMPALAASGDPNALKKASGAMMYIIEKQIELSGSAHDSDVKKLLSGEPAEEVQAEVEVEDVMERKVSDLTDSFIELSAIPDVQRSQQEQLDLLREGLGQIMQAMGISNEQMVPAEPITQPVQL